MKILLLMLTLTACDRPTNKSGQRISKPDTTCIHGVEYYVYHGSGGVGLAPSINGKNLTVTPCDMEEVHETP